MRDIPHRQLTRPKKVFEFFFDGALKSTAQEGVIKLEPIADGQLNAVCFWFDLHLDEDATITTAPPGIGKGGQMEVNDEAVRCSCVGRSISATNDSTSALHLHRRPCVMPRTTLSRKAASSMSLWQAASPAQARLLQRSTTGVRLCNTWSAKWRCVLPGGAVSSWL
jgi:protein arginine N-methyltransferase 7